MAASISARTIFIKAVPAPLTFAERRGVLHALQQHGKIEVFKKLQTGTSSFISVTTNEETVRHLVGKSPLTYQLVRGKKAGNINSVLSSWMSDNIAPKPEPLPVSPSATPPDTDEIEQKQFVLHIFASPEYNHVDAIKCSPIHGPWPRNPNKKSFISATLRQLTPLGIAQSGLIDWDAEKPPQFQVHDENTWYKRRNRKGREPGVFKGLAHLQQTNEAKD